jgi:hypothetical protein
MALRRRTPQSKMDPLADMRSLRKAVREISSIWVPDGVSPLGKLKPPEQAQMLVVPRTNDPVGGYQ